MRDGIVAPDRQDGHLTGRHVLGAMIAFFSVIFAVNAIFLYSALRTHTGVVAIEPYRKGLQYNNRIAAGDRQSELGWVEKIEALPDGRVSIRIVDAAGAGVTGLVITGSIGRPSTARHDRTLRTVETAAGSYLAQVGTLELGGWTVAIEARVTTSDVEPVFRTRRRLWLKP